MRHLPTTLTAMSSQILFSKDRLGPEALGRAGALRGQGHGGRAPVAPLPPPSPSGVNLPPQFMPVLGLPPGLRARRLGRAASIQRELPRRLVPTALEDALQSLGVGGLRSQRNTDSRYSLLGLQKGSQAKCEEVSESPEETSRPFQKFYLW